MDGTAFFVHTQEALYVVTAAHVAKKQYDLHAQVPLRTVPAGETLWMELRLPRSRWDFHQDEGDETTHGVDIAVMKIPAARNVRVVAFRYCPSECPKGVENQLLADPEPPQGVMVFGFSNDPNLELSRPTPMGRQGIVSLVAGERLIKAEGKYFDAGTFLVDMKIFPGNSGSPVMTLPIIRRRRLSLLGVIIASDLVRDYAVAVPASRIRQVIDIASARRMDFEVWYSADQN